MRLWPLMIAVIAVFFWASPRGWWPVLVYAITGISFLMLSLARFVRWWQIQRDSAVLLFCAVNLLQGSALLMGALIAAPHPVYDFRAMLTPYVRYLWGAALPFFLVAVHLEVWWVVNVIAMRSQRHPPPNPPGPMPRDITKETVR